MEINNDLKLGVSLKFLKNGKKVRMVRYRRKRPLAHYIEAMPATKGEFLLNIDYGRGFKNFGTYLTKKDLLFAYKAFTEQYLVDFIRS